MSAVIVSLVALGLFCAVFRMLHLSIYAGEPRLFYKEGSQFVNSVLDLCPIFKEIYMPPLIWGKSGHLQTFIYAKLGRVKSPYPRGERCSVMMPDGATMTFDVFEPHKTHPSKGDFTMVLCPGIANSSETTYICTFVHYAQEHGYRVAVLNHLGALSSVPLTSSRMFTYGCTEEYGAMVDNVLTRYPDTRLMGVGFSMGGNVVVKYVGEDLSREQKFLCIMSLCQGYDAEQAIELAKDWAHLRRMYGYAMTCNQKKMLRRHYDILLGKDVQEKHNIDADQVLAATSLYELDEAYGRRRAGFKSVKEYYVSSSCRYCINQISLPMFLLNATDDPLVPPPLVEIGKQYAMSHTNSLLVETRHGGHLGFFESGILTPDPITWLDRSALQYAEAIVTLFVANKLPHQKFKQA
ncbi:monoacylglycerol lipase ABHD2-like [Ostrea edulis]|uniref:monoacylglycerol lipase ABHD2-like n=1 Tax=Ostrea edulis TaxID=37623 RepID=UPI0024AF26F7|nr:monoacylglycerol lipase ABHD2-like [Ostrea edulis]